MLINRETTLSLRCPACGLLIADYIHAFSFSGNKNPEIYCSCGQKKASIRREGNEKYFLVCLCAVCEEEHVLSFSAGEFWDDKPRPIKCPESGIQLGKLGPQKDLVGKLEAIAEQLQGDDFFINPDLVLRLLDRLQGLVQEGKLGCLCGSREVHVDLFPDRIKLICQNCAGEVVLPACRDCDLERLNRRKSVFIPGYVPKEKREKNP